MFELKIYLYILICQYFIEGKIDRKFVFSKISCYHAHTLYLNFFFMLTQFKDSREFLEKRGHMVAFLMLALAATVWIHTFQDAITPAFAAVYL